MTQRQSFVTLIAQTALALAALVCATILGVIGLVHLGLYARRALRA